MQDHEDSDESDTDSRDSFSDHSKNMLSLRTTAEELGFDEWKQIYMTAVVLKSHLKSLHLPTYTSEQLKDVDEDELLEMIPPELFNLLVWVENMNPEFLICFLYVFTFNSISQKLSYRLLF